jgi:hypothetical protein
MRTCTTCQHIKRSEIDRRLAAGEPVAQLARDYELSASSLQRHRVNCLSLASSSAIKKEAARGTAVVALLQCKMSCPLYPRKRTLAAQNEMSALGQKRTSDSEKSMLARGGALRYKPCEFLFRNLFEYSGQHGCIKVGHDLNDATAAHHHREAICLLVVDPRLDNTAALETEVHFFPVSGDVDKSCCERSIEPAKKWAERPVNYFLLGVVNA